MFSRVLCGTRAMRLLKGGVTHLLRIVALRDMSYCEGMERLD